MTLSPVFRSQDAVRALIASGHFESLAPSISAEREYTRALRRLLDDVISERFLSNEEESDDDIEFLQEHFFLILFDSIFRSLDCPPHRLKMYGILNLTLKGMIVAGDNLFDGEAKMDLPLKLGEGPRFLSIMQLLCFDHLMVRVFETNPEHGSPDQVVRFRRELLTRLARIGTLEGSEEAGRDEILPVQEMVDRVHRVRGGQLFSLSMIAPLIWEDPVTLDRWRKATDGIARLGTAFQIVDDLTDFEFDLKRRSHNLLAAQIHHHGSPDEKSTLTRLRGGSKPDGATAEEHFADSAKTILTLARHEAEAGFEALAGVGFWFPPQDAEMFIRAIAGDAGDRRMHAVANAAQPAL